MGQPKATRPAQTRTGPKASEDAEAIKTHVNARVEIIAHELRAVYEQRLEKWVAPCAAPPGPALGCAMCPPDGASLLGCCSLARRALSNGIFDEATNRTRMQAMYRSALLERLNWSELEREAAEAVRAGKSVPGVAPPSTAKRGSLTFKLEKLASPLRQVRQQLSIVRHLSGSVQRGSLGAGVRGRARALPTSSRPPSLPSRQPSKAAPAGQQASQ